MIILMQSGDTFFAEINGVKVECEVINTGYSEACFTVNAKIKLPPKIMNISAGYYSKESTEEEQFEAVKQ